MEQKVLVAKNIYKFFGGVQALKNVSFEVSPAQIHCLVGENGSGKSTFVKIIAGEYSPENGEIILNGNSYSKLTVPEAIKEGIQVIYQDFSLFEHMSVAENIATNKLIVQNKPLISWREIYQIAEKQLDKIGVKLDLKGPVEDLSIANKQLIAICRALSLDAKIIFMDEPTTALTKSEVDRLISIVLELKKKGISIVFISHKLDEVMKVADKVAVFKDGEKVGDFLSSEVTEKMLTYYMTGREVEFPRYSRKIKSESNVLEVQSLTKKGHYKNINFSLRKGDILGMTGLLGAGRTELALSLFGLNPVDSGTVILEGQKCRIKSPKEAIKMGLSLLPENRHKQGCYMGKSLTENICSVILDNFRKAFSILDYKAMDKRAQETISEFRIVTESPQTKVNNLSGGNQQKVVLARWIATQPKVLVLDSPTVGVDVGSKSEIYDRIQQFANEGMSIILISDEIPEIIANCNKVLIMQTGHIVAYMEGEELNQPDIHDKIFELMNSKDVG